MNYRGDGTTTLSDMEFTTSGAIQMYLDNRGYLGIGTTSPLAPLHVAASPGTFNITGATSDTNFSFLNTTVLSNTASVPAQGGASIIAESGIVTHGGLYSINGTFSASDARLKNVIGHSDSSKDLQLLNQLEVTDYTYIDKMTSGGRAQKKLIAQQVECVMPQVITERTDFLPDIYALASKVETADGNCMITLAKAHNLKSGDRVRLIVEGAPEVRADVKVLNDTQFQFTLANAIKSKVFVYGKEHDDVRAIDYDAIAMLNVSATQELAKEVEALKSENAKLKSQANELTDLRNRMETLEKAMVSSHESRDAARTVSLTQQ